MVAEGCIYGRFQPFHNDHLALAQSAIERCAFLWIGLSDPFPADPAATDAEKRAASGHPLSYHERQGMITRTLVAEGIPPERFSFTPFPIRTPALLPEFLDRQVTCFLTGNDGATRERSRILEEIGYPVEVLSEDGPGIRSADILALVRDKDDRWRDLVPFSVASYLFEVDLESRLEDKEP